jgi:N,N'-diacetyllegionaminate synthase
LLCGDCMTKKFEIKTPYLIAETAYNHEGNIDYLYRMIDEIIDIKADAVKFHLLLNPESYMVKTHPLMEQTKEWLFNQHQWSEIIDYSTNKGLDVIALCDDVDSIKFINKINSHIRGIEIHATGLNDYFLLKESSEFTRTVILGIGGSSIDEIQFAVDFLKEKGKEDILLMYGFQSFPTEYTDINLRKMMTIRNLFDLPVGYADHTHFDDPNNEIVSIMAATMGVSILEKHFTLEEGAKRIDYAAAVGKKKMKSIKKLMNLALQVYGDGNIGMSNSEKVYGNVGPMKKAVVARNEVRRGKKIMLDDVWFKRTEQDSSLMQKQLFSIIGLRAKKDITIDELIDFSKVEFEFKHLNEKIVGLDQKK